MIKTLTQNIIKLSPFLIPTILFLVLIRCYVFSQYDSVLYQYKTAYLLQGCLIDVWVTIIFGGLFILSSTIFEWIFKRKFYYIFHSLVLIYLIFQFGLSQYFIIMQIPLDESIFFQRLEDLILVIDLKNYLKWYYILIVLFAFFAYVYLGKIFIKRNLNYKILVSIILLSLVTYPFSFYESSKLEKTYTMNNPLRYFLKKTQDYLLQSNVNAQLIFPKDFQTLDKQVFPIAPEDENYPMFHALQINKEWNEQFNLDEKNPPHLVFILVESLNNYFIGEEGVNEIGNHMPFLNELAKKSIYFPNTFSTCERTLNVLPAVCASLPNAPDENGTMMLDPLPKLFSLQGIFSKQYHSRFYCGVDLSFTNMGPFMSSIETDYLVNRWQKNASNFNHEYYNDEAIFKQSLVDPIPADKSRMDFILTYNTHEPFRYPNIKYYTNKVKLALEDKNIPEEKQKHILKNAAKIGAYTYLDDELKKYFALKEKTKEHKNTIYFIVGDHGSELINFKPFDRFRTSLLVYSPLLKKPKTSNAVVSHLDIMPSVLSLLSMYEKLNIPNQNACNGRPLKISDEMKWDRTLIFKGNNLKNFAILDGKQYFDQGTLFHIDRSQMFHIVKDQNKIKYYQNQLNAYNQLTRYLLLQDRLIPRLYAYQFSEKDIFVPVHEFMNKDEHTIKDQFIVIGEFKQNLKNIEKLKVNVVLKLKEKNLNENDFPSLVCSISSQKGKESKLLYYKGSSFKRQHRANGYCEMYYETIIDTKSLNRKGKLKFDYYLYQSVPKQLIFNLIEAKIYAVKKNG